MLISRRLHLQRFIKGIWYFREESPHVKSKKRCGNKVEMLVFMMDDASVVERA